MFPLLFPLLYRCIIVATKVKPPVIKDEAVKDIPLIKDEPFKDVPLIKDELIKDIPLIVVELYFGDGTKKYRCVSSLF